MISTKNAKNEAKVYYENHFGRHDFVAHQLMEQFNNLQFVEKYNKKLDDFKSKIGYDNFDPEFKETILDFGKSLSAYLSRDKTKRYYDFTIK